MFIKTKKLEKRKYYLSYTIIFFIVSVIIFLPFLIRGRSFISLADGYNQSYPAYVYIGQYIRNLFECIITHDSIPTYDFSIGFGNDIITTLNCYGLGDIFNITAFLSCAQYSEILLTITIILKIYTAGITFSIWGRYHRFSSPSLLTAAIFYAFNGYTYAFGLLFPSFMIIAQITLPLLILGIDMLLENEQIWKISRIFILAVFIQALNGFYFLYMEIIFGIIYFLVRFFVLYKGQWKNFFLRAFNIAWQFLLGIGMASIFFIPVLLEFLKSPRSEESSFSFMQIIEMNPLNTWIERLEGLISGPGYGSGLGLCAVAVACIIFVYSTPRKYPELKILLTIMGGSYCLPIVGSIMNGFSYSTERWLFLLYFLIAAAIATVIPELEQISKKYLSILILIFAIWIIALFTIKGINLQSILRIIILGSSWLSVIYILGKKPKFSIMPMEKLLSMLALTGIILVGVFNNFPEAVGGKGFSAMFKEGNIYQSVNNSKFAQYAKEDSLDTNALRTDIYDTCLNASIILNVNGTTSYYSIINPSIYYFLNEYIVSPSIEGSSFTFRGLDSRLALEMLLSVKSYTDTISAENIYENPYTLPLGFTFDSYILNEDAQKEDVLDRNASLIETVTLETKPQSQKLTQVKQLKHQWKEISIAPTYENIQVDEDILYAGQNAAIHIPLNELNISEEMEYYLYFDNMVYLGGQIYQDLDIEGKRMRLRPSGSYSGQQNIYMVKVPVTPELLEKGRIDITFPDEGTYRLGRMELRELNISSYSDIYQKRKETYLQNLTIKGSEINGTLQTESDKLLFMSIPYSTGWTCYLDGTEVPIIRANTGFCAIEVPAGEHLVVWKYNTPGLKSGIFLSTISCLIFILLLVRKNFKSLK